jgi:ribosomal protein L23
MAYEFLPSKYHIYCSVPSTDRHSKTGVYTFRVARTNDKAEIAGLIEDDRRQSADTFGGLIDKPQAIRTYSVFEAEWRKVDITG